MCIRCLHCINKFPVGNRSRGVSCIKLEIWDICGLKRFRWETLTEVGCSHQHTRVTPSTRFLCTRSYSPGPVPELKGSTLDSGYSPSSQGHSSRLRLRLVPVRWLACPSIDSWKRWRHSLRVKLRSSHYLKVLPNPTETKTLKRASQKA